MFNSSQNLIAELSYPFLFNTNFEIKGGIDMIKKDSSFFFNFNSKLIINYKSLAPIFLMAFYLLTITPRIF